MKNIYSVTFCEDGNVNVEKLFLNETDAQKYLDERFQEELTKAKDWLVQINDMESLVVHDSDEKYKSVELGGNWFSFNINEVESPI